MYFRYFARTHTPAHNQSGPIEYIQLLALQQFSFDVALLRSKRCLCLLCKPHFRAPAAASAAPLLMSIDGQKYTSSDIRRRASPSWPQSHTRTDSREKCLSSLSIRYSLGKSRGLGKGKGKNFMVWYMT